ncbi:hypothetical protein TeGR_g7930 [Tetraparma gracilis]|uniref:Uncharacterized protein n=1 Tax=Tetraparma gracilis TaxID=2962635 RepID=A0ABQ6MYD8_9STRA|nr:hypothetical protein TeGR_g7930 [Tetraparma gracilis]
MPSAITRALAPATTAPHVCAHECLSTSPDQAEAFKKLMSGRSPADVIPVEWIVDICDAQSGWFIGTAYGYTEKVDNSNPGKPKVKASVHVVVPDKSNPTWEGDVDVHWTSLRLIECCDEGGASQALFTEIVRDSVVPVSWQVEWCQPSLEEEEEEDDEAFFTEGDALYLVRFMNCLICRPSRGGQEGAGGEVAKTPDRLLRCLGGGGHEARGAYADCTGVVDFERLVTEGVVDWSGEGPSEEVYRESEASKRRVRSPPTKGAEAGRGGSPPATQEVKEKRTPTPNQKSMEERRDDHMTKLTQLYLRMRESMGHALAERERCVEQRKDMIDCLVK